MSTSSSRDGEKILGAELTGARDLLRKEWAHGKQGRKTLGARQCSDTPGAELSLPSEANSMQHFAIYTDNFTRGDAGRL